MNTNFNFSKPVYIGSDHAGFAYKKQIIDWLQHNDILVTDEGAYSATSADYPDFAHPVATAVANNEAAFGILICGSANGVAITANKHQNVRAGLCWQNEVAQLVRQHNNANIICLPARFVAVEEAIAMIETFMNTAFEGGRHAQRVNKIACT